MGTLIIFIAMILVAAVAASVLIQTTGSLQNKALQTGKTATREIGTSVQTVSLFGEDGSDQDIEYMYYTIKLVSGSEDMKFSDSLIIMSTDNSSSEFNYNSSVDCDQTDNFSTTSYGYGVKYSIQGNNYKSGYLSRGDVVKICFRSTRNLIEDDEIRIVFIPKNGVPHTINPITPELMVDKRIYIYP